MYLILITVLSKQNYIQCEKQQFIKLGKCQNIISNSNIDRIIGQLHQIENINIVTHQLNHKYYRAMDIIKDRVYYSAEYTQSLIVQIVAMSNFIEMEKHYLVRLNIF